MDLALISSEVVTTWVTACEEICSATINQRKRVSGSERISFTFLNRWIWRRALLQSDSSFAIFCMPSLVRGFFDFP